MPVRSPRTISLLLPLLWLAAPASGAEPPPFEYATNAGTITITRYLGAAGEVIVPEAVGDLPVTRIGAAAFYRARGLTGITIPQSVTLIENRPFDLALGAFAGCEELVAINVAPLNPAYASVEGVLFDQGQTNLLVCPAGKAGVYRLPARVTRIAEGAFAGCGKLTGITMPDSVARIGNGAFENCGRLASLTVPAPVTWLGSRTFAGCRSLTHVLLPEGLIRIEDGAFSDCASLPHITIPASVTTIGEWAFSGCRGLAQITIPAGVTSIGSWAFTGAATLKTISVDAANPAYSGMDGVLFDKNRATLLACPEGKSGAYVIPPGVSHIERGAFANCGQLSGIALPESVTGIGDRAFAGCASLQGIAIPRGVTLVPGAAFANCGSLAGITLPNTVTRIDGGAFAGCTNLASLTIPDGVIEIGDTAFADCVRLAAIRTPRSVTRVEPAAFQNCAGLVTATFAGNLASLGNGPFHNCGRLEGVYFEGDAPGGLVATSTLAMFNAPRATVYYLPEQAGWGAVFGGRPATPWLPRIESVRLGLTGGNEFGFTLAWASGKQVVVEASATLSNPVWPAVGTNILTEGHSFFSVPAGTNPPGRFFRLRSP